MAEYALIVNGVFREIKNFSQQPTNVPHKQVVWLPVVHETVEYDPRNQYVDSLTRIDPTQFTIYQVAHNISRDEMVQKVINERERRLQLGFAHDFGDSRGIHQIGTTYADMLGWDEVTKAASALVSLGLSTQTIDVVTDTGPVQVTAVEWLQVILGATAARQPIWAASFTLQAMPTIPADYAEDSYWE